jgi:polyphosphate kinase 2 (PPK2 family)
MAGDDRNAAHDAIARLQIRMLQIQQACFRDRRRMVLVFEGPDAAGKGGAIRRLTERLDPRGVHVWPIGPPEESEAGHHYLHRFWTRLPAPGSIAIFDRSWYGRVLVERVEKLAPRPDWERAYDEIVAFEKLLTDDGVRLVKFFVAITKREQLRRFRQRALAPHKLWKLTEADLRAHRLWEEYEKARREMLKRTSSRFAPWHVVDGSDKTRARAEILRIATGALGRGLDVKPRKLAKPLRQKLEKLLGEKLE